MTVQSRSKRFLLFALILLGGLAATAKLPVIAQTQPGSLRLVDMVRFYSGLPHQARSLQLLQQQIDNRDPQLLQADSIAANVWRNSTTLVGHTDIFNQISAKNRTGPDPLTLATNAANVRVGGPVDIEVLPSPGVESPSQVMVTITQGGILDDSVAGVRNRFDIQQQNGQWTIQRAGRQVRCQAGRGHQDFSAEICS